MASRSLRNICIYGAGALGGSMAAKLATGLGEQAVVSVVARGAHLESIRQNGLRVFEPGASSAIEARISATADPGELPPQDLVITGLKGHQLAAAAPGIAKLLHSGTRVLMIFTGTGKAISRKPSSMSSTPAAHSGVC
jgi:2-dehydropantoate 2-reductase